MEGDVTNPKQQPRALQQSQPSAGNGTALGEYGEDNAFGGLPAEDVAHKFPAHQVHRDVVSGTSSLEIDATLNRRRVLLSVFSRYCNELETLDPAETDDVLLRRYSDNLHESFEKYSRAHDYVIHCLSFDPCNANDELIDSLRLRHSTVCDRLQYLEPSYLKLSDCKGQSRSRLAEPTRDDRSVHSEVV